MFRLLGILSALFGAIVLSSPARAHCDTISGPVVTAARTAVEALNPDLVLYWVRPEDEVTAGRVTPRFRCREMNGVADLLWMLRGLVHDL